MASKWRQNIPDLYMYESGWELAASTLEDPSLYVVKDVNDPPPLRWIWYWPGPGHLPTKVIAYLVDPDVHFPYGIEVEPDS